MNKQFVAILLIVVGLLLGIFIYTKDKSDNGSVGNGKVSNHTVGKGTAGVTLIEYGDLQCPACRQYFPIIKEIQDHYKDKISFTFRHYPLVQIHNNAFIAARAAEAAGKQGKFFEMHDLMYINQDTWSQLSNPTVMFENYANQLQLDINKFKSDMSSAEVAATINADLREAQATGSTSTPTFVLNGKRIESPRASLEEFAKVIDEAIQNNQ